MVDRSSILFLAAAAVAFAPVPALAQTWPATVVAAGARMAPAPAHTLVRIDRDPRLLRRPDTPRTEPDHRLRLSAVEVDDVPEVEIEAKDEWLDDQGFRVRPGRLAFKRRF